LHSALSHPACRQTGALIIWISVKITLTKSYLKMVLPLTRNQKIVIKVTQVFDSKKITLTN